MLWMWMGLAWAGWPCDGSTPAVDAVEAADAAWIAVPTVAGAQASPMEPVWALKGKEVEPFQGNQPLIAFRVGERVCGRPLTWRRRRDLQHLRTLFGQYAEAEPVDAATLAQLDPTGLASRPGTRVVAQRFERLIVTEWYPRDGACPLPIELRVFLASEGGVTLLAGHDVFPDRSLGCIDPRAALSPCVGRWDMGPVDDSHLSGECTEDAVAVSDGGRPSCVHIQTCEEVPFKGR
ncbi:MAG: hypothetical protein AB8H79_16520 [Myxococcota bacterium]